MKIGGLVFVAGITYGVVLKGAEWSFRDLGHFWNLRIVGFVNGEFSIGCKIRRVWLRGDFCFRRCYVDGWLIFWAIFMKKSIVLDLNILEEWIIGEIFCVLNNQGEFFQVFQKRSNGQIAPNRSLLWRIEWSRQPFSGLMCRISNQRESEACMFA